METPLLLGRENTIVNVVLFSGGRGSRVLSAQLINHPQVRLTLAINGYDDGASTGEVRRFLAVTALDLPIIEKMPHGWLAHSTHVARHFSNCLICDFLWRVLGKKP
jgi:hypothetical protein